MANKKNTLEKFEKNFSKADGCWNWTGATWITGYGRFNFNNKSEKAHRLSWAFYVGQIGKESCLLHRCDNRLCVNPDHLFIGSRADNNADKTQKNRQTKGADVNTAKLTSAKVIEIRESHEPTRNLAETYGVSYDHINKIKRREVWGHV